MRTFPNLQTGDVLLTEDNNTIHWPIAVFTDVHPGTDASFEWSPSGPPRESSSVPLQKFDNYRLLIVNYNHICLEVAVI